MIIIPEAPHPATYLGTNERWEVRKRHFTKRQAREAGMRALDLTRAASKLSYINPKENHADRIKVGTAWYQVGIWDPRDYNPSGTIYGTPESRAYCAPLIEVIDGLKAVFLATDNVNWAYISPSFPGANIRHHTDKLSRDRSVTALLGESRNELKDEEMGLVCFRQTPGDTYVLRPDTDTGITPSHHVQVHNDSRIALII